MQGEVYVSYTGISGTNMDSGIMTAEISGSVRHNEDGESGFNFTVLWQLPGGIQGKDSENAGWGFILGMERQNEQVWNTIQFCDNYLNEKFGNIFDAEGNLKNEEMSATVIAHINELVYQYFDRVIWNSGLTDEYNWNRMKGFYGSCLVR